jgi:hypothetical protein
MQSKHCKDESRALDGNLAHSFLIIDRTVLRRPVIFRSRFPKTFPLPKLFTSCFHWYFLIPYLSLFLKRLHNTRGLITRYPKRWLIYGHRCKVGKPMRIGDLIYVTTACYVTDIRRVCKDCKQGCNILNMIHSTWKLCTCSWWKWCFDIHKFVCNSQVCEHYNV